MRKSSQQFHPPQTSSQPELKGYSSSSDSQGDEQEGEEELYQYLPPPNALIEKDNEIKNLVKTAFKLTFKKLPNYVWENSESKHSVPKPKVERKYFDEDLMINMGVDVNPRFARNDDAPNGGDAKENKNQRSLFSLYPMDDPRLVYRKYQNNGDFQLDQPLYATYFIDLNKIVRNKKKVKIQYQDHSEEVPASEQALEKKKDLIFDSNFESGNLFAAFKISDNEYDLILQNDINTKGHTQWFFFSVKNIAKNQKVKFNIINLLKPDSMFNYGMKPFILSSTEHQVSGMTWMRDGSNISYYKNHIMREGITRTASYYTLTFTYEFKYSYDTVYFAHCLPYTYSDLNNYLNQLCNDSRTKNLVTRRSLCKTLAKNDCDYLTITSNKHIQNIDQRYGIVISARQHPGETLASFMMQGVMDFLSGEEEEAEYLRQNCVFKIIPMLNPDGVIHGNYRTSLAGTDLNRKWKKPQKTLHPTIYHTKRLMKMFGSKRQLVLYTDLHGHSRKKNAFFYGNHNATNPTATRIFPLICAKASEYMKFEDSRFAVQKCKENTARIAMWKELKLDTIYTLEASFSSFINQEGKKQVFLREDYINLGRDLCKSMYIYISQVLMGITQPTKSVESIKPDDAESKKKRPAAPKTEPKKETTPTKPFIDAGALLKDLKQNKELIDIGNKSDDSGSDSNPSEDDIPKEKISKYMPRKKNQKIRPEKKKTTIRPQVTVNVNVNVNTEATLKKNQPQAKSAPAIKIIPKRTTIVAQNKVEPGTTESEAQTEEIIFENMDNMEFLVKLDDIVGVFAPTPIKTKNYSTQTTNAARRYNPTHASQQYATILTYNSQPNLYNKQQINIKSYEANNSNNKSPFEIKGAKVEQEAKLLRDQYLEEQKRIYRSSERAFFQNKSKLSNQQNELYQAKYYITGSRKVIEPQKQQDNMVNISDPPKFLKKSDTDKNIRKRTFHPNMLPEVGNRSKGELSPSSKMASGLMSFNQTEDKGQKNLPPQQEQEKQVANTFIEFKGIPQNTDKRPGSNMIKANYPVSMKKILAPKKGAIGSLVQSQQLPSNNSLDSRQKQTPFQEYHKQRTGGPTNQIDANLLKRESIQNFHQRTGTAEGKARAESQSQREARLQYSSAIDEAKSSSMVMRSSQQYQNTYKSTAGTPKAGSTSKKQAFQDFNSLPSPQGRKTQMNSNQQFEEQLKQTNQGQQGNPFSAAKQQFERASSSKKLNAVESKNRYQTYMNPKLVLK